MSRLIIVLGMHRSGTSLVTKSLECLGVSLGDRADWSGPDNPAGFWEDLDILAIDEAVLQRYGAAWDALNLDLTKPVIISDLAAQAHRVLARKLDRFPLLAIKDPRLCRLMPFWRPVIERIGCEVSFVRVSRSAEAIVDSLVRRNGMTREHAHALVREHNHGIVNASAMATQPVALAFYTSMVTDPAQEVRHVGHTLGMPVDETRLTWFCREFVRKDAA